MSIALAANSLRLSHHPCIRVGVGRKRPSRVRYRNPLHMQSRSVSQTRTDATRCTYSQGLYHQRKLKVSATTNEQHQRLRSLRVSSKIERLRFVEDPHVAFARESPATVEEPHCRSMIKCDYRSAPPSHADRMARG